MASIPVDVADNIDRPFEGVSNGQFIRVIVADTQAIFRAGRVAASESSDARRGGDARRR